MRVILFSKNMHKAKEIQNILKNTKVDLYSNFIETFDVEENKDSFKENAILKVKALKNRLPKDLNENCILMSEDSGICIDALDNKPGIYSSRYASVDNITNAKDIDNINKVIKELNNKNLQSSKAYFISCVASIKNNQIFTTHGFLYGRVINEILGNDGFGYDPIFIPNGYEQSLGELNQEIKDSISHRFKALKLMKLLIK